MREKERKRDTRWRRRAQKEVDWRERDRVYVTSWNNEPPFDTLYIQIIGDIVNCGNNDNNLLQEMEVNTVTLFFYT